ncbi:MAG: cobalamin biosynthesis protein [Desulfovermiculus sp.]
MRQRAVFALTAQGAKLARSLGSGLPAEVYLPRKLSGPGELSFAHLQDAVNQAWTAYTQLIFIAASGIVVRTIAPLLQGKDRDPAVVVLDQQGHFAVSLISGHLGGANDLAREVAALTRGEAVITTATDCQGLSAIDQIARTQDMLPEPVRAIKNINTALLENRQVRILDPEDRLGWGGSLPPGYVPAETGAGSGPLVEVSWQADSFSRADLVLRPRCLVAGMGCNTLTSSREILGLIRSVFGQHNLALASLKCLVSTSKKSEEAGLRQAATELGVDFICILHHRLQNIIVPNPSTTVHKHMGVSSICEATALLHTNSGRLLIPKTKSTNATLAVALLP